MVYLAGTQTVGIDRKSGIGRSTRFRAPTSVDCPMVRCRTCPAPCALTTAGAGAGVFWGCQSTAIASSRARWTAMDDR